VSGSSRGVSSTTCRGGCVPEACCRAPWQLAGWQRTHSGCTHHTQDTQHTMPAPPPPPRPPPGS
jgi:hypothetical protein